MKDKILVVDSNPFLLSIVKSTLESTRYKVYTALDGESGLEQFHYRHPDLLIVDVMLPHLSGWEVCRRIRKLSDLPIIIHTPVQSPDYLLQAGKLGVCHYLVKPIMPKVLTSYVEQALKPQLPQPESLPPKPPLLSVDMPTLAEYA